MDATHLAQTADDHLDTAYLIHLEVIRDGHKGRAAVHETVARLAEFPAIPHQQMLALAEAAQECVANGVEP